MAFYIPTYSLTNGAVSKLNADFRTRLFYMPCSLHFINEKIQVRSMDPSTRAKSFETVIHFCAT